MADRRLGRDFRPGRPNFRDEGDRWSSGAELPNLHTGAANLVPLCDEHHHQVHEGGWTLTLDADRTITLRAPDGTIRYIGDTRDRLPADRLDPDVLAAVDPQRGWLTESDHDSDTDGPDDRLCDRRLTDLARTRLRALTRCHDHTTRDHRDTGSATQQRRRP